MRIEIATLKKLFPHIIYSGIYTCLSVISFSIVLNIATPELETFKNFYYNGNLSTWLNQYVFDPVALAFYITMLFISIILSTIGLTSVIFAKHFHDRAKDILKNEIKI
jgi:hypothetical protein